VIYRLPTRGSTRYRGQYPHNIRSVGAGEGTVHLETMNGVRYVAPSREFALLPNCGADPSEFTRSRSFSCLHINAHMYRALLEAAQLRNQRTDRGAVRALLAKWDSAFAGVVR